VNGNPLKPTPSSPVSVPKNQQKINLQSAAYYLLCIKSGII